MWGKNMSFIEGNITINLPDGVDANSIIDQIRNLITQATGNDTDVNIIEIDNPASVNVINVSKELGS